MAAAGEWELVKNSRKKASSVPNGKLSKEERKNFIEKTPRVTATGKECGVVSKLRRVVWSLWLDSADKCTKVFRHSECWGASGAVLPGVCPGKCYQSG